MSLDFKLRRALSGLVLSGQLWNPVWLGAARTPEIVRICSESRPSAEELYEEAIALWDGAPKLDLVDRTLEFFTTFYLQDDILTKVDRAAMMSSLESRAVFLDNDLVEFCRASADETEISERKGQYLLKKFSRCLPAHIVDRPRRALEYRWRCGSEKYPNMSP